MKLSEVSTFLVNVLCIICILYCVSAITIKNTKPLKDERVIAASWQEGKQWAAPSIIDGKIIFVNMELGKVERQHEN